MKVRIENVMLLMFGTAMVTILMMAISYQGDMRKASPKVLTMNVSAYCPCSKCCGRFADGITASGHHIQPGDRLVAAPAAYPFGTRMIIPGYGEAPVLDRGGAIKGNKLDVFFHSHAEALQWGRQQIEVIILEDSHGTTEN